MVLVVHAFSIQGWRGFLLGLLVGALYVVAGGWLAFFPFTGIVTLTLLLAALFLAEGVLEVIMAMRVRPHEGWVWLLLSGLIAIAVGAMIAAELPSSAAGPSACSPASTCSRPASASSYWPWPAGARGWWVTA